MKFITIISFFLSFNVLAKPLSIMTYNLENLFDTVHDEGKLDWTYLPKALKDNSKEVRKYCSRLSNYYYRKTCYQLDWNEQVLENKLNNLKRVIESARPFHKKSIDILVFQEVENINVLKMLAKKLNYTHVSLIEGEDARGIDVGVISKYPIIKETIYDIDLKPYSRGKTRPILEVMIKVGNKTLALFANHWPSQGNVDQTRLAVSKALKEKALAVKADLVVLAGDFNTSQDDKINGIKKNILPDFIDSEVKGRLESNVEAQGTHWYRGTWESLDKIFVRKDFENKVDFQSFEIVYHPFMLIDFGVTDSFSFANKGEEGRGVPRRFDANKYSGYSDHLPVAIGFNL